MKRLRVEAARRMGPVERLENLRRRWLALFGLTPDDRRRFIAASVIV